MDVRFSVANQSQYLIELFQKQIKKEELVACFEQLDARLIYPLKVLVSYEYLSENHL
ncbi:hypothetical protein [Bacillus sp. JCM 19041]|uniref:hypothetical protein n=1 Tax=Bacillus sp. JCM 19041 TaxID=1460637 RepID=UPI000AA78267